MMYTLEVRGEADAEITEAYTWYEEQLTGLGERFVQELESVIQKITTAPYNYKIARSVYRQTSLKSFPFVVYFEIRDNTIVIYSVFHTSKKQRNHF